MTSGDDTGEVRWSGQSTKDYRGGVSYPGPRDVLGAPPSLKNMKYTRTRHFKNEIQKFFLKRALRECFPGPRCKSRRAWGWSWK